MFNTAFFPDTEKLNELVITLNNRLQAFQDLLNEMELMLRNGYIGALNLETV